MGDIRAHHEFQFYNRAKVYVRRMSGWRWVWCVAPQNLSRSCQQRREICNIFYYDDVNEETHTINECHGC